MWVDNGREFYNKNVKKLVELYSTDSIELLRKKMFEYLSANNTRKCADVLNLLVDQYHNAIHSSIKMTPKEASRKKNENKMWRNLYPEFDSKTMTPKFSIGDNFAIAKKKENIFQRIHSRMDGRGFKISTIQSTISVTYKITDYNGEEIQVHFMNKNFKRRSNTYLG